MFCINTAGRERYLTVEHAVGTEPNTNPASWVHCGNTFNHFSNQSESVLVAAAVCISALVRAALQETVKFAL
jgi:hypothetical protein